MSDIDKLWFEMGVRDNVSKVLERVLDQAEQLGLEIDKLKPKFEKNLIVNAENLERVYDRIGVAIERINEARSKTKNKGELDQLKDMKKHLDSMVKMFQKFENSDKMVKLPGTAAFERLVQQFQLAMEQVTRYTNEIDKEAKIDERNKAAEAKRIDDLQAKYNELYRIRRQLQDAVINASPDSNTTEAVKDVNKLSAIMGAVKRAQASGGMMPKSADGADYAEYLRKIRERIQNLTSATADYNTRLRDNESIRQSLNRIKLDTESQQTIAVIRNQTAEYNALSLKLRNLAGLMARVKAEEQGIANGTITQPTYTRDRVTQELEAIQRQYNETLARGKQALMDDADAKRKNEAATRRMTEAAKEVNRVNADMVNSFNRVLDKVTHSNRMIGQLQQQFAGYVGLYGLERLLKNVIQIGGEFEIQHIALQSILGDIQQANSMFEQMKELAVVSPFNFRQLASYSKQIAAFGIPYEEMYDTTKRLADMAAGLGVDMGRLILAYGQVRSAAVLRGQELRQFTEAGIPMVQALAQEFTKLNGRAVSTAEVFELISKRAVPFEMVKKVMWDMTNEGGRFYDMQFTLSDTLAGKWSNLQDAWEIMLSEFARGESMSGKFLKGAVSGITALIEAANTLMPLLAGIGLFFAGRRITNAFKNSGLSGLDAQITKAQNLQRIELRRMYLNQEITREQYEQRMAMNNSQARYYLLLAQEGKLKDYQIQRLITQKQINNARLQELVKSGELTMREAAQVRLWRMKNGEISAFRMQMNGMMSGVGSFFKANAWLIGIDLAITALTTWYTRSEEAKAKNEELKNGFVNTAKSLKEAYASIEKETPLNTEEYKKGLDGLKELLKQYSSDYERIIREAQSHGKDSQMMFGTDPIVAEYNFLKGILKDEQKILEEAESKAESFGEATRDAFEKAKESARFVTTGRQSFWDVMSGADTDVQRGLNTSIKKLYEKILESIPDVGKNETSNELYRKLRDSIEEQLGIGSKEKMLINIKLNELFNIDNIEDATTLVVDKFGDMLNQTEPEIANKIRYSTNGLNDAEKDKVAELIREASEETKKRYPYYADTLQKLLNDSNFIANIQLRFSGTGGAVSEYQKQVYDNFPVVTSEKQKITAVNWAKSGSSYAAANAAKKDIDDAKNELVAREREYKAGKTTAERVQKAKEEYEEKVQAALVGIGYDYEGENKKSNKVKGGSTSKKDTELEKVKNQVDLYKKFYSELENYSKIYGKSAALSKLRKDGEFGAVFGWDNVSDVSNYRKTVRELTSELKNNSEARDKFLNSTRADIQAKARKEETEAIKNYVSELQRMMSVMSENYDTYKKWLDLTGNSALAARVAGVAENTSYSDWLTGRMNDELKKTNLALSASDVFGLSESQAKKLGEGNGLFKVWEEWQKNQQKIKKEQLDLYEDAIKNSKSYEDRIADINRKLREELELIKKMDISQAEKDKLTQQRTDNANKDIANERWKQFKDDNNWGEIFSNLDRMTTKSINQMITKMQELLPTIEADETAVKDLYNALDKMRKEYSERNPLGTMFGSIQQSSRLRQLLNNVVSKKGSFTPDAVSAKYYGLEAGKTYSKEDIQGKIKDISSDFVEGLKGLTAGFKSVEDVLSPVVKLFDALGDTTISEGLNIGGEALGAASQVSSGLQSLGLEKLGPYGAAAAAGLSVVTSIFALHDKALQREIEASQARQKEMENLTDNLQSVLERTLGSIYGATTGKDIISSLINEIRNPYQGWADWKADLFDVDNTSEYRSYLKQETIDAVKNAEKTKKYYDATYASLLAQRDELVHQMNSESEKKNSDSDKLADYRQQITEMEDQIKYFAQDMAKSLWDIDVKSWAKTLSDTIVDAWKNGENAVDAYKNKVKEMMLDLTSNILSQKVMEKMLEKIGLDNLINELMLSTKGELDMDAVAQIADRLSIAAEEGSELITSILDQMESKGYISKDDESTTSSTGGTSIKSISESTADIIAGYINAIRADVSVNRVTLAQILSAVQSSSEMPVIARAQLEQLQQIVANTNRNANAAELIYEILHRVAPDGTYIKIK